MEKEFTPNVEHFKNFENLNFKERIELCFVKNNLDTFNIGIDDNKVCAISGIKYSDFFKVPDGKKYYYLHPKSEEEENIIIRIFEDNNFFIEKKYALFDLKVDRVLSFDFLKENWRIRFEKALLKDEFLSKEIKNVKCIIELSNGILNHFKEFYDLGVKKAENGGMINVYFWQLYFKHYADNRIFSRFHTLVSCLRAYYNGYFMFTYYAYLRNGDVEGLNLRSKLKTNLNKFKSPTNKEKLLIKALIKEVKNSPKISKTDLAQSMGNSGVCSTRTVFTFFKKIDREEVKVNEFTAIYLEKYSSIN
jgi:hypothetical protein